MTLATGSKLGPYEILSLLGAGGMPDVYCARDTKLSRDVARKVLLSEVASDPERMARFKRMARLLALLNRTNIAAIYGSEECGSVSALIMELAEGPTLADRISHGPIALDEALSITPRAPKGSSSAEHLNSSGIAGGLPPGMRNGRLQH